MKISYTDILPNYLSMVAIIFFPSRRPHLANHPLPMSAFVHFCLTPLPPPALTCRHPLWMAPKSFWGEIKSIFHYFQRTSRSQKLSQTWQCAFKLMSLTFYWTSVMLKINGKYIFRRNDVKSFFPIIFRLLYWIYMIFLLETRHFIKALCKQKVKTFFLSTLIALSLIWVGEEVILPPVGFLLITQ